MDVEVDVLVEVAVVVGIVVARVVVVLLGKVTIISKNLAVLGALVVVVLGW